MKATIYFTHLTKECPEIIEDIDEVIHDGGIIKIFQKDKQFWVNVDTIFSLTIEGVGE